jgi:hypothetical protein
VPLNERDMDRSGLALTQAVRPGLFDCEEIFSTIDLFGLFPSKHHGKRARLDEPEPVRGCLDGIVNNFGLQHSSFGICLLVHGVGKNLSMLLRAHAASHPSLASEVAALRVPFPRHFW